jgi:transposase
LGVKDHRVVKVQESEGGLEILLDRKRARHLPCSVCGGQSKVYDRLKERRWRHVPLWGIVTTICYRPSRVRCKRCGIKVERIPWGASKSPLSLPLVILLATWSKLLAMEVVARLFDVSWSTVASAVKQAVAYGLEHRQTDQVFYIGIDEISRRKGHVYHTQIYDLASKRLLWSGEGRREETIKAFFDFWGKERCARLKGICCDMWKPYMSMIRRYAPDAALVFDKFHLVRHLHNAVDQVRKEEVRNLKEEHSGLLKGTKYIWLKNPWNLTPKQRQRFGLLEKLNMKINRAYLLKEAFRQLWTYRSRAWARKFLNKWFWWATHSRLKPMRDFAWLLRRHQEDVLSWFDCPIDNGAVEALNNVAKSISHRAHGFRTENWFTTVMLHGMGQLPLPQFHHKFF